MNYGVPTIRGTKKPKQPSAEAVQQQLVQQFLSGLTSKWEVQAVCKGSQDPAAHLQAAKTLQNFLQYLAQHRSTCKHKATKTLLQKQLPPQLLLTLLSSSQDEVVGVALQAAQDLAWLSVVPVDAGPRLVQLLCCPTHGAAAARALTAQLSHWRFSQVWPHWSAAGTTARLYQHLQHLHVQAQADVSGGSTASRAADGCVSTLVLLSKLMLLAAQHLLAQLAMDAHTAGRWLQLLSLVGRQHSSLAGSHASLQLQDSYCAVLAGLAHAPATSLALQHSAQLRQGVLQLLHGVLRRPCCVSEADAGQVQCWMHAAAAGSLPVFWQQHQHQHEDTQQLASTLAPHEEQQLLADIAIAAAATLCNECFSSSLIAKQVDGAAANLLAAALLPSDGVYGSHRSCSSRFMAAVLGSNCCHVLLHALAVSPNTSPEHAARLAAAAAAATAASAAHVSTLAGSRFTQPVMPDHPVEQPLQPAEVATDARSPASGSVVLAPVQQELQPAWLLLRMISAQCAAVVACADSSTAGAPVGTRSSAAPFGLTDSHPSSDSSGCWPRTHVKQQMALLHVANSSAMGSSVEPGQVLRVVQAYSGHITTGSDAHRVPGLLRSLHFLMCQSVLVLRHGPSSQRQQQDGAAQQSKQQQEERKQLERLQWLSLTTDGTCSSCSSNSDSEGAELSAGGQQLLSTAAAVLDLLNSSQEDLQPPAAAATQRPASSGASSGSSKATTSTHQLSWSLAGSVYVALAVTVYLQERAPGANSPTAGAGAAGECLSATDSCLGLAAMQLAAAALKLLLPVAVSSQTQGQVAAADASLGTAAPAAAGTAEQQRQQQALVLPVYEALECSLAAVQALAMLSSIVQPALPGLLSQCVNNSTGYLGHKFAAAGHASGSSSEQDGSQAGGVITLAATKAIITGAAEALDALLQQLLSQVVLSWQAVPVSSTQADSTHASLGSSRSGSQGSQVAQPQLSVHAGLQQHLQEELRCLAAAALASCYGQLGAQTSQGTVLGPFRDHGAPFSDVQLQLGPSQRMAGHAAVLAAGCPVLRQQLYNAAAAAVGATVNGGDNACCASEQVRAGACSTSSNSTLVLKLSAAVDYQALQQALDFIYTGAAVLPHAGLASQLQLCSSCLSPARGQGSRRLSEQKLAVLQQQQLRELQEQQQTAKQQLHKLGMLARKLQLPLLAALTRGNRPQPGQRLPNLHLSFAALLPQQLLLPDAAFWQQRQPPANGTGAGRCAGSSSLAGQGGQQQQQEVQPGGQNGHFNSRSDADTTHAVDQAGQQQQGKQRDQHWQQEQDWQHCQGPAEPQQALQQVHPSSTEYLDMLAASTASGHDAAVLQLCSMQAGILPAELCGQQRGSAARGSCGCQLTTVGGSFADAYLAAPVSMTGGCSRLHKQHSCPSGPAISAEAQSAGVWPDSTGLQEGPGQVQCAFLPAHRVILSGCCPYFEALLSDRWHHEEYMPPMQAGSLQDGSAQHASAQAQQQQQQAQAARVVLVPEADIHVAAALQHFLYTGTLQVQLPTQVLRTAGAAAHAAAAAEEVRSNGCSAGCHQARTLLRLWRCAELLLLPQLQALCVAAVAAAAWQLDIGCCFVLLADCCQLGVPAAADGLLAALTYRADRDTAAALPAWAELPSGLQTVLIKAWADRRLQQDAGEDLAPLLAAPASAGVTGSPAAAPSAVLGPLGTVPAAAGQLIIPAGSLRGGLQMGQGVMGGAGGPAGVIGAAVQAHGLGGQHGLVLQQQPLASSQAAVVLWQRVQDFREAGLSLGDVVSTQLAGHKS